MTFNGSTWRCATCGIDVPSGCSHSCPGNITTTSGRNEPTKALRLAWIDALKEENHELRVDLNRALDALAEGVALWHDEQRYVSGERVGRFLSAARAVLAAHDRET